MHFSGQGIALAGKRRVAAHDMRQLIDLFSLPAETAQLVTHLQAAKKIITIEENVLAGGMGSYILELLSDNQMVKPVKRLGLQFKDGYYDKFISREYVREEQGLSEASIEKAIREMVG